MFLLFPLHHCCAAMFTSFLHLDPLFICLPGSTVEFFLFRLYYEHDYLCFYICAPAITFYVVMCKLLTR